MKTYYSSSKFANYAHIHMYVFYNFFIKEIKRLDLDYAGSYSINVNIDGNIAVWQLEFGDPQVQHIFETLIENSDFITSKRIQEATKMVAEKMNKQFEITDSELLLSEIENIKLTTKKPNVEDDDSLCSPAVKFY